MPEYLLMIVDPSIEVADIVKQKINNTCLKFQAPISWDQDLSLQPYKLTWRKLMNDDEAYKLQSPYSEDIVRYFTNRLLSEIAEEFKTGPIGFLLLKKC